MTFKAIATACVAFSLVAVPAERVMADGDALIGGIVGGIIGGVIVNEANKNRAKKKTYSSSSKKKTYTSSSSSGVSSAQREQNREVQTALNYFGFPVGTPDGSIGPRSRAAIAEYQATMGFPGTGQLNDFERDILVSSYYRAQSGGAATATLMATNPRGAKGVLIAWKDERLGIGTPQGTLANGTGLGAATFAAPVVAGAVAPAMPTFSAAPVVPGLPAATAALPSFMAQGASTVSLASMCSQVSVVTSTNGGYMTQLNMTDPSLALSEQFCLARAYAIGQSDDLVSKVSGFTPQQIADQCAGFAPVMKDYVSSVSLKPRQDVINDVLAFVTNSGMAPAQLAGTAKICLGIGYKVDNPELAMGSALLLGVMGERAYGELVGHHLAAGIGAAPRPDLAMAWFDAALGDPSEPIVQIFAPQMPDRAGLIRMAAYARAGQPLPGGSIPAPTPAAPEPALPTFTAEPAPAPAAQPESGGGFGFKIPFLSNP